MKSLIRRLRFDNDEMTQQELANRGSEKYAALLVRRYFAFPVRNTSRYGTAGLFVVSRKLLNLPRLNQST